MDLPLLCLGGSAGSLGPLLELVRGLPADLPAAVLVVVHTGEHHPSRLPEVLGRHAQLPVGWARDGLDLRAGAVHVAPPGHHLLVSEGRLALSRGPRVNRHRPSIDVLFASAARAAGPEAVGVVLSGVLDDGAVGSALLAHGGGRVLTEDPGTATFPTMPRAALAAAPGARAVPVAGLAAAATAAVLEAGARLDRSSPSSKEAPVSMSDSGDPSFLFAGETQLTRLACPECGGGLARVDLPQIIYFRCHTGHHYGPQTLAVAQAEASEAHLWSAVAALEEQAVVARYLDDVGAGVPEGADHPDDLARRVETLRGLARAWATVPDPELEPGAG